jgi:hypothetical protein
MRRPGVLKAVVLALSAAGMIVLSPILPGAGATGTALRAGAVTATPLGSGASSPPQVGQLPRSNQTPSPFTPAAPAASPSPNQRGPHQVPHPAPPGKSEKGSPPPSVSSVNVPIVSCQPLGPGCDAISTSHGGASTNLYGLAATANGRLYGQDVEPPDQGLCAGNGYVMEATNIGEVQVFNSDLSPASPIVSLDSLMGLTSLGWSSGGDVMCLYDPDSGGHWFITEFVSTNSEASGGAFTGCFAGVLDACREGLAVSSNDNPLTTTWNVYFLDPNQLSPNDPGAGYLLNDFAKIGNTQDALLLFYDEFNLNPATVPACPAYGCLGFNGSQELALQKSALEAGATQVNMVHVNMGTDPAIQPPDGSCASGPTAGITCWYQDIPASSPSASDFDNNFGGTGFMVGSLDFTGEGDSRVAVFYWTGLSNLDSKNCRACSQIAFGGQVFTGVEPYMDEGAGCPASEGGVCGLGAQKAGTLDLGTYCKKLAALIGYTGTAPRCPEGGIASNGDGTTQASYAGGQIWFAISTLVNETFGPASEIHTGAAYWVVSPGATGPAPTFTLTNQGYVAAAHEDIEFPTLVGGSAAEGAVMSFTLSGNGGPSGADGGGYFPSSAFSRVTASSVGSVGNTVYLTAMGQAPQDGFSEYVPTPATARPRWGDYGAGVYVPGVGFYFASEYVPYANCDPLYWYHVDETCGGTRDPFANYGTSVSFLP